MLPSFRLEQKAGRMRASFVGQLIRVYEKEFERDGTKGRKAVADILVAGEGGEKAEVITVNLAPGVPVDAAPGNVAVSAIFKAWAINGKHGLSYSSARLVGAK